jgi:acyl-CoA reductase-like NAD-dependent aldehyde dehydrogenase
MALLKLQNFIGGSYVPPMQGKYIESMCPSTGKPHCLVPDSCAQDIAAAVVAAKTAFPAWAAKTALERSNTLLRVAELLEKRLDEFAAAESLDQGKTLRTARTVDIPRCVKNFHFFATAILHHNESAVMSDNEALNYVHRTPVGVAGLISPWNLPLYLLTWKIAPALACGNTVVCKPSELSSVTAWMLCQVLNEAGVPPGVVNMVFGLGASAGHALVVHPDVPLISFTGGTATGELVIKASAPLYKRLSLELGGKNPNIIFADADLAECVATSVRSSFSNQGEICLCGSRIYVQQAVYERFLALFLEAASKWRVGDPREPDTMVGALISADHLAKVSGFLRIAREEGAKILLGSERVEAPKGFEGGYWMAPTVIADVSPSSCLQTDEIFGPVVTISKFASEEEVLQLANGVRYGLSASVWTADVKRAHRVAHALEVGQVWVNCWMYRDLRVPFGGVKHSGYGREGGEHSIDFFTNVKTVVIKL